MRLHHNTGFTERFSALSFADEQKYKETLEEENLEDIDLGDPELNKAATKIQASFRGHKARKGINQIQTQQPEKSEQ